MVRRVCLLLVFVLAAALIPAPASAEIPWRQPHFTPGAAGIGDEYFPLDGNGGYDVAHYDLQLKYTPDDGVLIGRTTIIAQATQDLSSFDLDLLGMTVQTVRVNGLKAKWTRDGQELVITPKLGLRKGWPFVVTVSYKGVPSTVDDEFGPGWLATDDGALVIGEPHGAATWFPVNDHPTDKATYTMHIAVPTGLEAISNGSLLSQRTSNGFTTWNWSMDKPMASYLATATIGDFTLNQFTENGIDYVEALDPDLFAPAVTPVTGDQQVYSQAASNSYKRLARTIAVPADGATVSFEVNRQTERTWDFFFVEAHTVGADDWTTLPDLNGHSADYPGNGCPFWFDIHPFLTHYEADDGTDEGTCVPTGTTGTWSAASGSSDGYEEWSVDLSAYAGTDVELSLSYASDETVQAPGVFIDDIEVSTGEGSTSFEDDGDTFDGWTVPGAPAGSPGNDNDWITAGITEVASVGTVAQTSFDTLPTVHQFEASLFGPYPFHDGGGIVDDAEGLGFALENQSRPIYALDFFFDQAQGNSVIVHENAHQWFGDSVSVQRWADIWLNEAFATYAEWLADEEFNGTPTEASLEFYYNYWSADHPLWSVVIGDPGTEALFDNAVYYRGAMTLQVLRNTIGDDAFFQILQTWTATKAYGNGSIPEFIALAEQISGQDLTDLFQTWLYTPSKPELAFPAARMAGLPMPWLTKTLDPAAPRR